MISNHREQSCTVLLITLPLDGDCGKTAICILTIRDVGSRQLLSSDADLYYLREYQTHRLHTTSFASCLVDHRVSLWRVISISENTHESNLERRVVVRNGDSQEDRFL